MMMLFAFAFALRAQDHNYYQENGSPVLFTVFSLSAAGSEAQNILCNLCIVCIVHMTYVLNIIIFPVGSGGAAAEAAN